ncbi:DNA alkylation repair protein [Paludibacterium paludis]|uniref:DNA alkylation repair protein n=2 Tax=Paludibacterium paludis TaxID=1225769 RepID=A0A918P5M2_9NEIS|nr:DNA alkylation repair protein [Paludibacterium paludis]
MRKAELENGSTSTRNLSECLAIDQAELIRQVLPGLGLGDDLAAVLDEYATASGKGISHQISAIGCAIGKALHRHDEVSRQARQERLIRHPSDTVRSWAAFAMTRSDPAMTLGDRLGVAKTFAADEHFGVREWSWLAVRPYIAEHIGEAIALLESWTMSPDPNIRRFAVESTRPRGVWCEHIAALKTDPAMGLPLLEPLRADPARYVQDSVGNWLNDASKTAPEWVDRLCRYWADAGAGEPSTARIVTRAIRSLRKGGT